MKLAAFAAVLVLLTAASSVSAQPQFMFITVLDDVPSGGIGILRDSSDLGPYPDRMPTTTVATPNIDALAAAGFVHPDFHVSSVCSETRATMMTGLPASRHNIGNVKDPDADPSEHSVPWHDLDHLFKQAKRGGYTKIAVAGKIHLDHYWPGDPSKDRTLLEELGVTWAPYVWTGNLESELLGETPRVDDSAGHPDWAECGGSNWYFDTIDLVGNITTHRETAYSTDLIGQALYDWMTAQTEGKILVWFAPWHPHGPWDVGPYDGVGGTEGCNYVNPVGSVLEPVKHNNPAGTTPATESATYQAAIERVDFWIGAIVNDILDIVTRDHVVITSDNGVPNPVSTTGMMAECDEAGAGIGGKLTPYRCGTGVPFIAAGPDIAAGKILTKGRLNGAVDFMPTVLDLMGIRSTVHGGRSFAPCMREDLINGHQFSATNCDTLTRDFILWWEFRPLGGMTDGTLSLMPDPDTQADEYNNFEASGLTYGDGPILLHGVWDTSPSPAMTLGSEAWTPDTTQQGRYGGSVAGPATNTATDWVEDADWIVPPSAEESANVDKLKAAIDKTIRMRGLPTSSTGGG